MDDALIAKFLIFLSQKSPDVFWIRNADYSKQIYISSSYEKIWQRDPQELYQFPEKWADYLYPEDYATMQASTSQRNLDISPAMEFYTQYRILRPSGEIRYIKDHSFPIFDENKRHIGFAGIARDVTEEVLLNESLLKSKDAAEAASRAKTEFLANMSHDMKTPLTGVITMAYLMANDMTARSSDRNNAEIIHSSGEQILSFFNSCLELSKMEIQAWASKTEIFSLKQLLQDIHALFAPRAISKHLTLKIDYDETLPELVEGHRDSLYRVLLNLVGNAIKFTEQGSVILRAVNIKQTDDQPIKVEFQVQDTGIGIPEDKHKVIFEKLHRLTPSYKSKIEGSGIGLYIVEQYVKRMDGDIQVKSTVGEGSLFLVTVPLISANKTMAPSTITPPVDEVVQTDKIPISINIASASNYETENTDHLPRVLVVEDTDIIQVVTKNLLHTAGFSVDIAATGEEAVDMFEPGKYGLIYMDIGLPKMNGYETAQAIRAKEKTLNVVTQIPIIALTGHGAVDVQAFCGEAGMQGVLSKPLSREQAEMVWQHFNMGANVSIPGLTLLTNAKPEPSDNEILDIDVTIKIIGVKDIAVNLIATFVEDLKNQFLPQIKTFISEHKDDELRFLLHQQLGSLAYAKAPRLEKKLSDVQAMVHKGTQLDQAVYQEIEQEVLQIIQFYQKIEEKLLC